MDGYIWWVYPRKESSSIPLAAPPLRFVVVMVCHDDHQKMKGFLTRLGSWDFAPHLMWSGSATHIMATWHVLTSGINAPTMWLLGFPLNFSFRALVFKLSFSSLFPSLFPISQSLLYASSSPPCFCDFLQTSAFCGWVMVTSFKVCSSFPFSLLFCGIDK